VKGIVLVPSLNRINLLKNFLTSFWDTASPSVSLAVLVDSCDYEVNKADYEKLSTHLVITGDAVSMGDKVRYYWSEVKRLNYDWVGLLNDDHYCITKHWDKIINEMIDGTNVVSTNDGFWNFGFRVVGLTAWSMPLLDACQFPIFPKGIDHWFIDDIWKAIGDQTGCLRETMRVNIEHRHAFIGKSQVDETFKISQDPVKAQEAFKVYEKFMAEEFPAVCQRIIKLRKEQILRSKFN